MSKGPPLTPEEEATMQLNRKVVGELLRTRRVALGLSRIEAAHAIGVTTTTITRWESGLADSTSTRMMNFMMGFDMEHVNEMWRRRALVAEAALRDINVGIKEYRKAIGEDPILRYERAKRRAN
jgi:transcriptional regulator with XRE-family HTH domain